VVGAHGIVGVIAGHQFMERARAILRIFPELSSGGVTLRNIWRPYHGTRQNRRWRYILKYLYLARDGKRRKLRGAQNIENWRGRESIKNWHGRESIKNWRGELAIFSPQKCNDQNTLWRGGSLIRMPHQIRDADSWAAVRSGCLIR